VPTERPPPKAPPAEPAADALERQPSSVSDAPPQLPPPPPPPQAADLVTGGGFALWVQPRTAELRHVVPAPPDEAEEGTAAEPTPTSAPWVRHVGEEACRAIEGSLDSRGFRERQLRVALRAHNAHVAARNAMAIKQQLPAPDGDSAPPAEPEPTLGVPTSHSLADGDVKVESDGDVKFESGA
jgi:hypothetical protein